MTDTLDLLNINKIDSNEALVIFKGEFVISESDRSRFVHEFIALIDEYRI